MINGNLNLKIKSVIIKDKQWNIMKYNTELSCDIDTGQNVMGSNKTKEPQA